MPRRTHKVGGQRAVGGAGTCQTLRTVGLRVHKTARNLLVLTRYRSQPLWPTGP